MKIAILGNHSKYSEMGSWVSNAWQANGHEIFKVDRKYSKLAPGMNIIFVVDCSEEIDVGNYEQPKIFWALDSHMPGGASRSVNIARKCDLTFSTNYEYGVKVLEKFGIESILMPITYNASWKLFDETSEDHDEYGIEEHAVEPKKEYDVVMIGHPNSPKRIELWETLKQFKTAKVGVANEWQYKDWMNRARCVVNQPTEPWDNILNNRFFEAMGYGALLLQKRLKTSLIEKLGFEEGKHFIYWSDMKELPELIEFYKKNHAKREEITSAAMEAVQKYSIESQVSKIESIILSKFYDRL